MTGSATLTGRFSVAVVTTSPESKVRIPVVFVMLPSAAVVAFSPKVNFDNKLPLIAVGQRNRPISPVIRRIASPCTDPAVRLSPEVQARKGEGQGKNPFLFAMLFEKNIETFFEWQPVGVVCFFLLPPAFPSLWAGWGDSGRGLYTSGLA